MIRDAVIHLNNEQPVVADLFAMPSAADAGIVCTNLRTPDGRRPIFIDATDSVFFFPYLHIRFVEIPPAAVAGASAAIAPAPTRASPRGGAAPEPVVVASATPAVPAGVDTDGDLEIDEDFLRRIREV